MGYTSIIANQSQTFTKVRDRDLQKQRPSDVNLQPILRANDIGYNPSHPDAKHCMQSQYTGLERRSRYVFAKQLKHPVAEPIVAY